MVKPAHRLAWVAAAALLLGATAAPPAAAPDQPGTVWVQASADERLSALVRARLQARALAVNVAARDGVVTLRGLVRSPEEKELAALIARRSTGVVEVRNALAVTRNPPRLLRLVRVESRPA